MSDDTATTAPLFNPLSPDFIRDPYPHYARMRAIDPMHRDAVRRLRCEPACRSKPGAARQAFRQGLCRADHAALRREDHGSSRSFGACVTGCCIRIRRIIRGCAGWW